MSVILSARTLTHSFGARALFKDISFSLQKNERVGLIGPNGAGKSTLLKILSGQIRADEGEVAAMRGLKVGYLAQVPEFSGDLTVYETLMNRAGDPEDWDNMAENQNKVEKWISQLDLKSLQERPVKTLSGGWQKRVALACELIHDPDLLLLDEPTNHLDVESIIWLEDYLVDAQCAVLLITHDRAFLQNVCQKILELDRRHKDGLLKVDGDYATYLELRAANLSAQEVAEQKLRNTLRRETEWMRSGSIARQKKSSSRKTRHGELKEVVDDLQQRNSSKTIRMGFHGLEKNPKKLIQAKQISYIIDGRTIVPKMDLLVTPKSRIGLLGVNGSGKSTLLKMLTKTLVPTTGEVDHADPLVVALFDQNRETLDPKVTLRESICPLGEYVDYGGQKVHVRTYLARFLFDYSQMDLPVGKLSGGEQSRLLLARLMLRPAQVLILDEPTNDLDVATLDVLQDILTEFSGAVLLVSHDRYFLDQCTSEILAFATDKKNEPVLERFAGLEQWMSWREQQPTQKPSEDASRQNAVPQAEAEPKKRLTYKDQRELDQMEGRIENAEKLVETLTAELNRPSPQRSNAQLVELTQKLSAAQFEVEKLYLRWTELTK